MSSGPTTGEGGWGSGSDLYSPSLITSSLNMPSKCSAQISEQSLSLTDAPVACAGIVDVVDSLQDMGLAAGGKMRQQVFEDNEFNVTDWDLEHGSRVFVHLVNSMVWQQITGQAPPQPPLTAAQYSAHGYPWYDYWDAEAKGLKGTKKTAGLKSVAQLEKEKGVKVLPENQPLPGVAKLIPQKGQVTDGEW